MTNKVMKKEFGLDLLEAIRRKHKETCEMYRMIGYKDRVIEELEKEQEQLLRTNRVLKFAKNLQESQNKNRS